MSNKYGSKTLFPTSKLLDAVLPPLSINITLLVSVRINVLSPCPTSIKLILSFFGVGKKLTINTVNIIITIIFLFFCFKIIAAQIK